MLGWNFFYQLKKKRDYIRQIFIQLSDGQIPRFFGFDLSNGITECHISVDPSIFNNGYIASTGDLKSNKANISFVIGKSRLPFLNEKAISIPELEFQTTATSVQIKIIYWNK